ncbi:MAG: hypothetical protein HZB51_23875 [Chloroflexi bacterium]|nr:hypothetical protein [Chloroflexota bacterium]
MPNTFPVIILIGRPAAGKSEVIDYLKHLPDGERCAKLHIAPFDEIDDFLWVWQIFEDDLVWERLGRSRRNTDSKFYFLDPFVWNFLIGKINLAFEKIIAKDANHFCAHTTLIEFARGGENGFGEAFSYLSDDILKRAVIVYVSVSYEESLRRNRRRAKLGQEDSILYHSLSDDKMESYYKTNDWDKLSGGQTEGRMNIKGHRVPFVVFQNEPEKTDEPVKLGAALQEALGRLWRIAQQ